MRVIARYGYMQSVNVTDVLLLAKLHGLETGSATTTFFLADERIVAATTSPLARWRKRLFIFLDRDAPSMTDFFRVPRGRVIELMTPVEL